MDRQKILEAQYVRLDWLDKLRLHHPQEYADLREIVRDWTAGTFAVGMTMAALCRGVQKQLPEALPVKDIKALARGVIRIQEELSNGPQPNNTSAGKRKGKKSASNRRTTGGAA